MIKFVNLEIACIESGFNLMEIDSNHWAVESSVYNFNLYIHKEEIWNFSFFMKFNYLEPDIKARLIKSITKDYEIAEKELEDAENNNM